MNYRRAQKGDISCDKCRHMIQQNLFYGGAFGGGMCCGRHESLYVAGEMTCDYGETSPPAPLLIKERGAREEIREGESNG